MVIGEKPPVTASSKTTGISRPVKIHGPSSSSMQQILMKSGRLKKLDWFKTVYISALTHHLQSVFNGNSLSVVMNLKTAISNRFSQPHFICGGKFITNNLLAGTKQEILICYGSKLLFRSADCNKYLHFVHLKVLIQHAFCHNYPSELHLLFTPSSAWS